MTPAPDWLLTVGMGSPTVQVLLAASYIWSVFVSPVTPSFPPATYIFARRQLHVSRSDNYT